MDSAIDDALKLGTLEEFLRQMANANAIATRGMGVDYASNFKRFVVGAGIGTGVNGVGASLTRGDSGLPEGGFAFQMTVMGGLNLGMFNKADDSFADRVAVFGNGLIMVAPESDGFGGTTKNMGAHIQIKPVLPKGNKVVGWGGLAFTTGYEFSSFRMVLKESIPIDAPVGDYEMTWKADGEFAIESHTSTIPLELSTNLKLLVVSPFVGGAFDINFINSSFADGDLSGPLTADVNGETVDVGTANLVVHMIDPETGGHGEVSGTMMTPRFFGGLQANILFLKLYGQVNVSLDESFGGHIGAPAGSASPGVWPARAL